MKINKNKLKKIDEIKGPPICKYCNTYHIETFQCPEKKRQLEIEKFIKDAYCNEFLASFIINNVEKLNDKISELEEKISELQNENTSLQRQITYNKKELEEKLHRKVEKPFEWGDDW